MFIYFIAKDLTNDVIDDVKSMSRYDNDMGHVDVSVFFVMEDSPVIKEEII